MKWLGEGKTAGLNCYKIDKQSLVVVEGELCAHFSSKYFFWSDFFADEGFTVRQMKTPRALYVEISSKLSQMVSSTLGPDCFSLKAHSLNVCRIPGLRWFIWTLLGSCA